MKNRREHDGKGYGTLFVVSTPIGNLEDITLRALRVLKSVDMIVAEKTVHTKRLCDYYGIKTRRATCHQHNQKAKTPELIRLLKSGHDLAIVTDAGTPGISDPGPYLIDQAAREDIAVSPIPGPSAVIAALSVSGFQSDQFVFVGFLPNKSGKRKKKLKGLLSERNTMVFYEAPHRVKAMLNDFSEIFGLRQMVMLREMTKIFEDVKRGAARDILEYLTQENTKGEFTLVVEGKKREEKDAGLSKEVLVRIEKLLTEGALTLKDISNLLSDEEGLAYRQVYKECLAKKREIERLGRDGIGQKT